MRLRALIALSLLIPLIAPSVAAAAPKSRVVCYTAFDSEYFYLAAVVQKPTIQASQRAIFADLFTDDCLVVALDLDAGSGATRRSARSATMVVSAAGGAQLYRGADARPVYETQMVPNGTAGIRRFSLREHGVTLEPNVEYRWTVAIVTDPENRSKDVVASGIIKHVPPSEKLSARLAAHPKDRAFVYADEGFWYDSLEELSVEIEQKPSERELRKVRGMLFLQAGLKEAAEHDLQTAGQATLPKLP